MEISVETIPDLKVVNDVAWNTYWQVFPSEIFLPCFGNVLRTVKRLPHYRLFQGSGIPVQHIAVRNIEDRAQLDAIFQCLQDNAIHRVLLIGGNATEHKLFESTLALLEQFDMKRFGITHVYFAGHPEGHMEMTDPISVLRQKVNLARTQGFTVGVISQFTFNRSALLEWIKQVEQFMQPEEIRIGLIGPTNLAKLMRFCKICGVNLPLLFLIQNFPKFIMGKYIGSSLIRVVKEYAPNIRFHVFGMSRPELAVKWLKSELSK